MKLEVCTEILDVYNNIQIDWLHGAQLSEYNANKRVKYPFLFISKVLSAIDSH